MTKEDGVPSSTTWVVTTQRVLLRRVQNRAMTALVCRAVKTRVVLCLSTEPVVMS